MIGAAVLLPVGVLPAADRPLLESEMLYVLHACLMAGICQICMYYAELYDFRVKLNNGKLFIKLLQSLGAAAVALAVLFYLVPALEIARGTLLLSLLCVFGSLAGWRLLYQWLLSTQQFRVNVLIIGTGEEARRLAGELLHSQPLGYNVRGFIGEINEVGKDVYEHENYR
jgi:FlaA1/EpsC-like NDP-sugar epimerase